MLFSFFEIGGSHYVIQIVLEFLDSGDLPIWPLEPLFDILGRHSDSQPLENLPTDS